MTTTRSWRTRMLALACAGTLLAGCATDSGDVEQTADAEQVATTASETGEVDPAALDTGDYRTTPSEPFGRATVDNILEVEAQRMAEFVTLPFEVDPELTADASKFPLQWAGQLNTSLAPDQIEAIEKTGILYGFATTAQAPAPDARSNPRTLVHVVIRANSPEDARTIAGDLHQANLTAADEFDRADDPWVPLDSRLEGARTTQGTNELGAGTAIHRQSVVAHGDYVIYDFVSTEAGDEQWADRAPGAAVEQQKPLIDRFPATPTDDQADGGEAEIPMMDQNDILIYAVPGDTEDAFAHDVAVYGPRGMAHGHPSPALVYEVLTETGAEHTATGRTVVYRAEDDEGAQRIFDEFTSDLVSRDHAPIESPQGLPAAECFSKVTPLGEEFFCMVRHGHYVGEAFADNAEEAAQLISAQYLILTEADQDY